MRITFNPKDENYPKDKVCNTNVGEFVPGQARTLLPHQEAEGRRLVANGDFDDDGAEPVSPANIEKEIANAGDAGKGDTGGTNTKDAKAAQKPKPNKKAEGTADAPKP